MGSNFHLKNNKKGRLHQLAFLFFMAWFSMGGKAQKMSKYYTSYTQKNGTLYHSFPIKKVFSTKGSKLSFDYTILSSQDSATVNLSYHTQNSTLLPFLILEKDTLSLKKLFVNFHKRGYHHRYSTTLSIAKLHALFESEQPSISTKQEVFKVCRKKWDKQSRIQRKIIQLIALNKTT